MREMVGRALSELVEKDDSVVVVTADVAHSTRAVYVARKKREKLVNVGISEQDMVGFASGLAIAGKKPFIVGFAMFIMRAWEQIRNTIDRMELNVKIIGTHSGFSDAYDGSSHQCIEDIALMRALVNMTVIVPADPLQTYDAIYASYQELDKPVYIRVGRDSTHIITEGKFRIGEIEILRDGTDIAIISAGPILYNVIQVHEMLRRKGYSTLVANLHTVKPVDSTTLEKIARKTGIIFVVEEHVKHGGIYSAVLEELSPRYPVPVYSISARNYGRSAKTTEDLYYYQGLDPRKIYKQVIKKLETRSSIER